MIFEAGSRRFHTVQTIMQGTVNDLYVCYEPDAPTRTYFTLIAVKDRGIAREMVRLLDAAKRRSGGAYLFSFSRQEQVCFLFEYRESRPIEHFFLGEARSQYECEELTLQVVMECLQAVEHLPYAIVELILNQKNVNLAQDGSVYFTYCLDLRQLHPDCTEQSCVTALACLLMRLLRQRQGGRSSAFELIERKIHRGSYSSFSELYHDVRLTAVPEKKTSLWRRFCRFFRERKDFFFRILMACCIILVVLALISLISQIFFGQNILHRMFFNSFKVIGTESMIQ